MVYSKISICDKIRECESNAESYEFPYLVLSGWSSFCRVKMSNTLIPHLEMLIRFTLGTRLVTVKATQVVKLLISLAVDYQIIAKARRKWYKRFFIPLWPKFIAQQHIQNPPISFHGKKCYEQKWLQYLQCLKMRYARKYIFRASYKIYSEIF